MKPSRPSIDDLLRVLTGASGEDDTAPLRQDRFTAGNLALADHAANTHVNQRRRYLEPQPAGAPPNRAG